LQEWEIIGLGILQVRDAHEFYQPPESWFSKFIPRHTSLSQLMPNHRLISAFSAHYNLHQQQETAGL